MRILPAVILFGLAGVSGYAYADTPEETAAECAQGRGNIKSCCTLKLDDSDDVQRCIRKATRLRSGSSQAETSPAAKPAQRPSTLRNETPARAEEPQQPPRAAGNRPGPAPQAVKSTAKYRIGDRFESHDMSHLPAGAWKPWTVTIHDNSYNQKEYGLKAADIKRFEKKLSDVTSLIKEVPALNPARGCAPSLSAYIDGVYDRVDPYSKRQPVRADIMFGCFKLYEAKRKNGKDTTAWEPDHETMHYILYINGLQELYAGNGTWSDGPSEIRPFDQFFQEPQQVGEHQGFPIYAQILPNGNLNRLYILIARKGVKPFLPVSRERFIKALNRKVETEIREKYLRRQPEDLPKDLTRMRATYRKQLESLQPDEKDQQACIVTKTYESMGKGNVPLGTPGCGPIVRLNPELFDPKVSRTAIQFLVISRFGEVQEKYNELAAGNRDALSHFRLEMDTIIQTDWNKVLGLFDKP